MCGDYLVADPTGRKCVMPKCDPNEKVIENGICMPCFPFTAVSDDKKSCLNRCKSNLLVLMDGSCKKCDPAKKVSKDQRNCINDLTCEGSRKLKNFPSSSKCTID